MANALVAANASAIVLRGADLDALSDNPDDLAADLAALAGPAAGPNGGATFIDGFSGGQLPPKESIREIRINQNPFSAEYDRLGFGRIEILTKPGTDKFHGQAFMNYGDENFNSRNPFSPDKAFYQQKFFGGNFSGPLSKKSSFFIDAERRSISDNAVINTVILDPKDPKRIFIAISAAGAFRTDDGGKSWKPINRGLRSQYIPDPNAEIGHCVHHVAMHKSRPNVLYMQKHWDVMRSDDAGDNWREVSGNLPTDFGFVIDVHAHDPETIYVVPIKSDSEHYVHEGKLRVFRSKSGGNEWEALTKGLPQSNCYVNVLRDAMAVDSLDKCGIYFGTTGGQVYASADAGDSWNPIVRDLPAVLSVEVQTLS